MSVITEVARDTFGISGYQEIRDGEMEVDISRSEKRFFGVIFGAFQVGMPLVHQKYSSLFNNPEKEWSKRNNSIAGIIELLSVGAILKIADLNPQEFIPVAVGAKVVYNAAASAVPRAIESARTRLKPQKAA